MACCKRESTVVGLATSAARPPRSQRLGSASKRSRPVFTSHLRSTAPRPSIVHHRENATCAQRQLCSAGAYDVATLAQQGHGDRYAEQQAPQSEEVLTDDEHREHEHRVESDV